MSEKLWVQSPLGKVEEHSPVNARELVRIAGWTYAKVEKENEDGVGADAPSGPEGDAGSDGEGEVAVAEVEAAAPEGEVEEAAPVSEGTDGSVTAAPVKKTKKAAS